METCSFCSKTFRKKSSRLCHTEDKHGRSSNITSSSWSCDLCSKSFRRESSMWMHKEDKIHVVRPGSGMKLRTYESVHVSHSFAPDADFNDFLDRYSVSQVHLYISQHLQTDESFREECSSVVDRVADFFKRSSLFTVNRFIKGGSLGKGTAIKSKSDIDCVMFIFELPSIDSHDYQRQLQRHLEQMEGALIRSKYSIAYNLEVVGRTGHAVKLRVQSQKRDHGAHDVDLLLATDLLGEDPTDAEKAAVFNTMASLDYYGKQNCSAALVELQRDFVKQQSPAVKELIRLVKMWKASCVTETSLTSYPLELLCIQTWPYYRTVPDAFKAVLQKLSNYNNICAYWTHNYSYSRVQAMLGKRGPLILDPANPYNNVADRCRNWPAVARAAQETLRKPFFSRF